MLNTSIIILLLGPKEINSITKRTLDPDRDSSTLDRESEVHTVTTVSPVNIPNHQPVFKGLLLHEHLLTRDFQGDEHFFRRDGSVAAYSTMPGSVSALDAGHPITQLVPHEDAPAFSDIATTATAAATSPLTTFFPTTPRPPMSLPQKKLPKEKTRGEDKVEPTTDSFTTQVTPNNRGSLIENDPVASSQRSQSQSFSAFPAEATPGPSSMRMEKEEARDTTGKNKTSPDHLLRNPTSVLREGMTTTSTTVTTTTTMQTGRHFHIFSDFH